MVQAVVKDRYHYPLTFMSFYFFVFFGFGSLSPLLPVYLRETGLSGSQIGIVMSISPVIMILIQPMWGLITDYTQRPRQVLTYTIFATGLFGYVFSLADGYWLFILFAALLAFFQSAIVPISDSITLNYVQQTRRDYGSFRLWGAIGFALSVLIIGRVAESLGLIVIFYFFAAVMIISGIFSWRMPEEAQQLESSMIDGFGRLIRIPQFVLFLLSTFLIFGPIYTNNFYFGIYIQDLGGTLTGVGIAFLLAAGSEAPFMKFASRIIHRMGVLPVLLLAATAAGFRWILYFLEPPLFLVYATTFIQGLSIGLYIPAALDYVKDIAPKEVRTTAVGLYSAMGNGVGTWFTTFIGGFIMERFSVAAIYVFFTILTILGISLLIMILRMSRT